MPGLFMEVGTETLEKYVIKEYDIPGACPICKSRIMVHKGRRTADPWPDEEGNLYDVELLYCKGCDKLFEYWPKPIE